MFRPGKGYTPSAKQPAAPGGWPMTMGRVLLFLPVLESERMEPSTAEERTGPFSACTGGICIRRGREALLRRARNRSRGILHDGCASPELHDRR